MADYLDTVIDKKAIEQVGELHDSLRKARLELVELIKEGTGQTSFSKIKLPSDLEEQLSKNTQYVKQLNKQLEEQKKINDNLQKSIERVANAKRQSNTKTAEEMENNRLLSRNAREYARISSKLSSEYEKQSTILNQLRRRQKDLALAKEQGIKLTKKETAEYNRLEKEITDLDGKLKKVDASVGQHQRSVGNYGKAWGNVGGIMNAAVAAFGVYSAMDIGRQIYQQIKEIDALDKALIKVTETQEGFNQAQQFLIELGERTGITLNELQRAYTKFYAAAKNTNLTLEQTQEIFENVATAGATLGLSTDDVNGALRALEQMLSKGKVQAEEIRGQLGERLPGAFQILAESMGVTTAELDKMLEKGEVIADDVLPNFAKQLEKTFSLENVEKVDTLNAAQGRLSNSWTQFVRTLSDSEGVISKTLKGVFEGLTLVADGLRLLNDGQNIKEQGVYNKILESQIDYYKQLGDQAKIVAEEDANRATSNINNIEAEIAAIEKKNTALQAEYDEMSFLNPMRDAVGYKLMQNKDRLDELSVSLSHQTAVRNAASRELIDHTDWLNKNKEANEENAGGTEKAAKREKEHSALIEQKTKILEGSKTSWENIIKLLESEQSRLAVSSEEWKKYEANIKLAKNALATVTDAFDAMEGVEMPNFTPELENDYIARGFQSMSNLLGQDMTSLMEEFNNNYEWDYENFLKWQEMKLKSLESSEGKFSDVQIERIHNWVGEAQMAFDAVLDIASGFSQRRIQNIEAEIEANNRMYDELLSNEQLSEEQRTLIQEEREKKNAKLEEEKRKEQEKQAKLQKAQAAMNVAIQTSLAVISALAQVPKFDFGVSATAVAATFAAVGAAQLAAVIAQPLPKYKTGRKGGREEMAIIGDGGKREPVFDKQGNFKYLSPDKPTITKLEAGDTVLPSLQHPDYQKLMNASVLASLTFDKQEYSNYEASKVFDHEMMKQEIKAGIKEGFRNVKINNTNNINNDALSRELKNQRLADV